MILDNPLIKNIVHLVQDWRLSGRKFFTILTFAVNYHLGKNNPFGYHLVNVLLHIAAALLLYHMLQTLFLTPELLKTPISKHKNLFSLFASLIFLSHPLQTQAVTYIWQRSEVLSGFFYLLSYLFYLKGRLKRNAWYYIGTIAVFFAGLYTKGTIVTLPIMILLAEICFFNPEKYKKIFAEIWPFLCLFFTLVVVFIAQIADFIRATLLLEISGAHFYPTYIFTQFRVIMRYIQLSFLPINQNFDHFFPPSISFFTLPVILSFSAIVVVIVFAVKLFKKHRLMSFGIFWFFIYLLPTSVLGLRDPIWEHRLYVSLAGFSVFLVSLIFAAFEDKKVRNIIVIVLIVIFGILTISRNALWRSPEALLKDTIKKSPLHYRPHHILGTIYYLDGKLEEAAAMFKRAIMLAPRYVESYNNLGLVYMNYGYLDIAATYFTKAISIRKNFITPYLNLSHIAFALGNYQQAEDYLKESLRFKETDKAYVGLGNVCIKRQEFDKAKAYFKKALELNPDSKDAALGIDKVRQLQDKELR